MALVLGRALSPYDARKLWSARVTTAAKASPALHEVVRSPHSPHRKLTMNNDDDELDTSEDAKIVAEGLQFHGATLDDARAHVREFMRTGVRCPCCGQYCRIYKRKMHATMALALVMIYHWFRQNPNAGWLHVPAFLVKVKRDSTIAGGDAAKLRFWGVIERAPGERDDGSDRIGRYRITEIGRQFVEGKIAIPRYVFLYNQSLLRVSEEMTTIREALGDRFSYEALMKS